LSPFPSLSPPPVVGGTSRRAFSHLIFCDEVLFSPFTDYGPIPFHIPLEKAKRPAFLFPAKMPINSLLVGLSLFHHSVVEYPDCWFLPWYQGGFLRTRPIFPFFFAEYFSRAFVLLISVSPFNDCLPPQVKWRRFRRNAPPMGSIMAPSLLPNSVPFIASFPHFCCPTSSFTLDTYGVSSPLVFLF